MSKFSAREYLRYGRHLQLPQLGAAGQQRLKDADVLIVGCGGLGVPVAMYLAGAGIGRLTLVDGDAVALGNLHRQVAFSERDVGANKAACLAAHLRALNSDIDIEAIESMYDAGNAAALTRGRSMVMDCSDQFSVRMLVNSACLAADVPWLYASVTGLSGQYALFEPGGPCFCCLFPSEPASARNCNSAGVLGALPGVLGTMQASAALLYLAAGENRQDDNTQARTQLTLLEAEPLQLQRFDVAKQPACPACSSISANTQPPVDTAAGAGQHGQASLQGSALEASTGISCEALAARLGDDDVQLVDVREQAERDAFNIGGLHIPMGELAGRLSELQSNRSVVLYCQSGQRSATACALLAEHGIESFNLEGGLQRWLETINK